MKTDFIDFEDWMLTKGFARATIKETLRKMRYFEARMDLNEREAILGFLRLERRAGATKLRINGYVKYINRWLQFTRQDKIEYLPELRSKSFKKKGFDAEQIKLILGRTVGPTVEDKRNHTMVMFALNTGLRRGEIARLKVKDIHQYFVSVVNGKGEKDRDVFLDQHTRQAVKDYLEIRNHPESEYVFTTRKGNITTEYMGNIAGDIKDRTKIREFSWHKCRHTYARNIIRNDVDLETLRQMLGHENLGTTQIYAELDTAEALERVMKKNVKFYKEGKEFKSSKPWTIVDGPMGI